MKRDLVIVGAGAAGMAAAVRAAEAGFRATVIDEMPHPGGRAFGRQALVLGLSERGVPGAEQAARQELISRFRLAEHRLEVLAETVVWGIFPERRLGVYRDGATDLLEAEHIILATGAEERAVPFPGWTLPGVRSALEVRAALAARVPLPPGRWLLAGSAAGLGVLAHQMLRAGAPPVAVLDAGALRDGWRFAQRVLYQPELAFDRLRNRLALWRAGVSYRERSAIVELRGAGRVEEARVARLDRDWVPLAGSERTFAVACVVLDFGAMPDTVLSRLAACRHVYDPVCGGWVPERSAEFETSVRAVYAVGAAAGTPGWLGAALEGRIAALAALGRMKVVAPAETEEELYRLRARLRRLRLARSMFAEASRVRAGIETLCRDDTVVCPCEGVTRAELGACLAEGMRTLDHLKRRTRAGAGTCQGRICTPYMAMLSALAPGGSYERAGWIRPRPPIRPIPFGAFAPQGEA